jgi:multicomponent Na+:H+ antiporter subunit B
LKWFASIVLVAFGALIMYAATGLPRRGALDAPPNRDRSVVGTPAAANYYIRNAERDANTPNIVTVILADYRGYDTLGELVVVLTAGLSCYLILRKPTQ